MNSVLLALKRGLFRIVALLVIGAAFLLLSLAVPLMLGSTVAPLMFGFGLTFLGLGVGDIALRVLQPEIDGQLSGRKALVENSTAAGLVYLGRCLLAGIILILIVTAARAGEIKQKTNQPEEYAILGLPKLLERPNAEICSLYCNSPSDWSAVCGMHKNWTDT